MKQAAKQILEDGDKSVVFETDAALQFQTTMAPETEPNQLPTEVAQPDPSDPVPEDAKSDGKAQLGNSLPLRKPDSVKMTIELYQRLCELNVIQDSSQNESDQEEGQDTESDITHIALNPSQKSSYLNGYMFASYIQALKQLKLRIQTTSKSLHKLDFDVDNEVMQRIDPTNTQESRQSNWQSILAQLQKLGIEEGQETRNQLVNGDQAGVEHMIQLIDDFVEANQTGQQVEIEVQSEVTVYDEAEETLQPTSTDLPVNPSAPPTLQQKKVVKNTVDVLNLDPSTPLEQICNSLEFLLVTLSQSFNLKPVTAAGLLTNNNKFLKSACLKGIKNQGFDPLLRWYNQVLENCDLLVQLMLQEYQEFGSKSFMDVLKTVACGLQSSQAALVNYSYMVLIKFFREIGKREEGGSEVQQIVYNWVTANASSQQEQGADMILMDAILAAMRSHNEVAAYNTVELFDSLKIFRVKIVSLYRNELQYHSSSHQQYIQAIQDLLPYLRAKPQVVQSGLLQQWLDYASREAENDGVNSYQTRIPATVLLTDLWLYFTDYVDSHEHVASVLVQILRKSCREPVRQVRLTSLMCVFRLLDTFSVHKNPSAPVLYRAVIFSILENFQDEIVREFCWSSFKQLYKLQPQVPVDFLVEPLATLIQNNTSSVTATDKIKLYDFDYEFLYFCGWHPKLQTQAAIKLLELLQSLMFQEQGQVYGRMFVEHYCSICKRFAEDTDIERVMLSFTQLCMYRLIEIEQTLSQPFQGTDKRKSLKRPAQLGSSLKMATQSLVAIGIPMEQQHIYQVQKGLIRLLFDKIREQSNPRVNGQMHEQLKQSQQNIQSMQNELQSTLGNSQLLEKLILDQEQSQLVPADDDESGRTGFSQTAMVPYHPSATQSASQMRFKATAVIQKIHSNWIDKESVKKVQLAETQRRDDRRKQNLKKQIDRRRVELGVPAIGAKGNEITPIIEVYENSKKIISKRDVHILSYYDTECEFEDQDKTSVDITIKNSQKLLNTMFLKYANKGHRMKTLQDRHGGFEMHRRVNETISSAEVIKMFRDFKVLKLFGLTEVQNLMRLVAVKLGVPTLLQFDFEQFKVLVVQAAMNIYTKHLPYLRPGEMLKRLVNHFEPVVVQKQILRDEDDEGEQDDEGEEEPDEEADVLLTLLERVEEDEDYVLPQGFRKVYERSETIEYRLPEDMHFFLGKARLLVVPILNELVNSLFEGVNFLEPYSSFDEELKISKVLSKPRGQVKAPDISHVVDQIKPFGVGGKPREIKLMPNSKVLLPPHIKLLIEDAQEDDRAVLGEVAQTVELIIRALERGEADDIYDTKPKPIVNRVMQAKETQREAAEEEAEEREQRRIQHAQEVKESLREMREQKELEAKKKRDAEEAAERARLAEEELIAKERALAEAKKNRGMKRKNSMVTTTPGGSSVPATPLNALKRKNSQLLTTPGTPIPATPLRSQSYRRNQDPQQTQVSTSKKLELSPAVTPSQQSRADQSKIGFRATPASTNKDLKSNRILLPEDIKIKANQTPAPGGFKLPALSPNKLQQAKSIKQRSLSVQQDQSPNIVSRPYTPLEEALKLPEIVKKPQSKVSQHIHKLHDVKQAHLLKELEFQQKDLALKNAIRKRTESLLNKTKDKRNQERKFEEDLNLFMTTDEVKSIFKLYDRAIEKYFKFYCQQGKLEMGFDMQFKQENMHFREFVKFGVESQLSPVLVTSEQLMQIFRTVTRIQATLPQGQSDLTNEGSSLADKNIIQYMSLPSFRKAMVRICVYAHGTLTGSTRQTVDKAAELVKDQQMKDLKLREFNLVKQQGRKQGTEQVLAEMRQEFDLQLQKSDLLLGRNEQVKSQQLMLIQEARREQEFIRYLKQQDSQGQGLQQRLDKKLGSYHQASLYMKGGAIATTTAALSKNYRELDQVGHIKDLLSKQDIRDNAITTKFQSDINLITSKTVDALFKYLGLEESTKNLTKKLNLQRVEQTGQKPQLKIKQKRLMDLEKLREAEDAARRSIEDEIERVKQMERRENQQMGDEERRERGRLSQIIRQRELAEVLSDVREKLAEMTEHAITIAEDRKLGYGLLENSGNIYNTEDEQWTQHNLDSDDAGADEGLDLSDALDQDYFKEALNTDGEGVVEEDQPAETPALIFDEESEPIFVIADELGKGEQLDFEEEYEPLVAVVVFEEEPEACRIQDVHLLKEIESIPVVHLEIVIEEQLTDPNELVIEDDDGLIAGKKNILSGAAVKVQDQVEQAEDYSFDDEDNDVGVVARGGESPLDLQHQLKRLESSLYQTERYQSTMEGRQLSFMSLPGFKNGP